MSELASTPVDDVRERERCAPPPAGQRDRRRNGKDNRRRRAPSFLASIHPSGGPSEQAGSGTSPLNLFVSGLDIYSSGNLGLTTSGIGLLQIGSGTNPFNLRIRGK